jgi:ABC-type transporter Mla MlaB component
MPFALDPIPDQGVNPSGHATVTLHLSGRLGVQHARPLWDALQPALRGGAAICVEARELEEMDSSMIQILCRLHRSRHLMVKEGAGEGFRASLERRGMEQCLAPDAAAAASAPIATAKVPAAAGAGKRKSRG